MSRGSGRFRSVGLQQVGLLRVGRVVVVVVVLVVVVVQIGPEGESPLHLARSEVPGVMKSLVVLGVSPGPLVVVANGKERELGGDEVAQGDGDLRHQLHGGG